jgi:peroxiredoxin
MLKLPLILLVLLGTCAAQDQHSLSQLQNARVLIVFAPDADGPNFKKQLELIQRHSFELSVRNTVVVPVSTSSRFGEERFSFENLPLASDSEQADARRRFHVQPGDFLVILLDENGTQKIRSAVPVDIHEVTASIDMLPAH